VCFPSSYICSTLLGGACHYGKLVATTSQSFYQLAVYYMHYRLVLVVVDNQYSLCLRIICGREEQHQRGRATFRKEIKTCYQSDFNFIGWTLTRGRAAVI
jgi:hypothetical protein